MRALYSLIAIVLAASAHADPQLTSWFTTGSGKYARQYTTAANRTAGTTATTWTGHTNPAYSDVYEVSYSANWVYVKYTGLPSYAIGPWFQPDGVTPGTIMPATQSVIRRFPRTPTVPAATAKSSTAAGTSGILVSGVHIFNNLDGQAWNGTAITGGAQHTNGTYYWHRVAPVAESYNFDYSLAHSNPAGAFHNHQNPIALRYQLGDHVDYNSSTKNYSENAAAVTAHSPILGYAHDGYPIYGPYGYSAATNAGSGLRRMVSGYVKRNGGTTGVDTVTSATTTMPAWYLRYRTNHALGGTTNPVSVARSANTTTYPIGTFAQDYSYLGDLIKTGTTYYAQATDFDLDEYNGRFCYTPEYPAGTYAYFATIDSGNAAAFPYLLNFEHYGATTLPLTLTSIVESVTSQVAAGPATPIAFTTTPSASGGNVTLTWNSVEGSSYTVENSTNQTSWTTRNTGLAAAMNATTTAQSIATIGSSGTEYGRVTRTTLATYDVPTTATAVTTSQTATGTYNVVANTAPTLTTISTLTGATEDTAFSISYATLAAAANEADVNGDAISFRIEAVSSGVLTINGANVAAGTTLFASGDTVVWTPAANANGTLTAFTVKAWDGALASSTAVQVNINVAAVNDAPTLTTINALANGIEDTVYNLTYAAVAAAANEADADGNAISFRVEETFSGALTKNGVTVTAGMLLSSGDTFVWTPPGDANGSYTAMTVTAYDGTLSSDAALAVSAYLTPVNDAPTMTTINAITGATEDTPFTLTYAALAAAADEADVDGDAISFLVSGLSTGTLTKNGVAAIAGSTLLSAGESFVWTPAANAFGYQTAFFAKAHDGTVASTSGIAVSVSVTNVVDGAIWTGGEGTSLWSDAANWIDLALPLSTDTVQFTGTAPYAINLNGDRSIGALAFRGSSAYTLSNNTLTLSNAATISTTNPATGALTHSIASAIAFGSSASAAIDPNAALTLSGAISGTSVALTKSGTGVLTMSGANTFTGSVAVNAGTLSIGSGSTSGALAANIANSSALVFNRSDASTYSGVISGAGSVEKKDAGTLTLTNTNTNTGGLTVSGGAVSFNTPAQLGASTNAITLNGGGLQWTANFVSDISTTRIITIGSAGATFDVGVYNVTLAGNFGNGGSGGLTKTGLLNSIHSLIIIGSPTYTGLTTVNAGFLIIGNNGTTGTLPGDAAVVGTGSLLIKRSNAYNYAGSISGAGVVSQEGAGTTSLTGAHTFTGNLQVVAGTLSIGNGGSTGSVATNGIVTSSGATLKWDTTTNTTYGGIISGAGALNKSSANTLTLTGTNTLSGTTTVSAGTLQLGSGAATGSIAGPVSISTGATLSINHSDNVTFPYTISGAGNFIKLGAGTLTLSGTHTRTGSTTVSAGTLSISSAALGDAADVSIASGATLNLNFSGTDTVGQLTLGGVHQYTGTWGSLTSSATHKSASITGNGILNVTTSSMLFTEWATLNGLDGTAGKEAGLGDDPDKDGVANALEFVLGGNPLTNTSSILPTAAVSGDYLTLSFSRTDESEYSVGVQILTSADLTTWTSVTVPVASGTEGGVIFTIIENGTDADTITAQIPIGTNTKMFARLSAATY